MARSAENTKQRILAFDEESGQSYTIELMEVGPELAAEMLKANTGNRRISVQTVDAYVRAMLNGEWKFAGDPIRLNKDGEVLDGGHRLTAIVKSGTTQRLTVISGIPTAYRKVMDQGRGRNVRDNLVIEGIVHPGDKASVANLLIRWEMGLITSKLKLQNQQVTDFVLANNDKLHLAVQQARTVRKEIGLSMGAGGAAYYKANQFDAFKANEFYTRLVTGTNLPAGSPIKALEKTIVRNKIGPVASRRRLNTLEELFYVVRAWNAYIKDERIAKMQLPQGSILTPANFVMV